MKPNTNSLKANISWAAAHLFEGRYYDKYKAGKLSAVELSLLCRSYRAHRWDMYDSRKWYEFKLKRNDGKIIKEIGELMTKINRVVNMGHPYDLSMYGVAATHRDSGATPPIDLSINTKGK